MQKIKLQLFGRFCVQSDKGILTEEMISSNQMIKLLVYILIYRERILSHQNLIEVFWDNDSKNPKGALKNLVYRLRNTLRLLGEEEFISTLPEAYQWNPEITVETDYEQWEELLAELKTTVDATRKEEICVRIIEGYHGNITSRVANESWILARVMGYQSGYLDTVKTLCGLLEQQKRWAEIEVFCNQAMKVDSLDEDIHCMFLRSLYGQNKYDLANLHYEKINKHFYESMGNYYPEKLREEYQKLLAENSDMESDTEAVLKELASKEEEKGAFVCDYQVFRQIYQMETRRLKRLGIAEYIMFLTLKRKSRLYQGTAVDSVLEQGMTTLEEQLRNSLRVGDAITRYSKTQFIVMLPACTYESGIKVGKRIEKQFMSTGKKLRLELKVELQEINAYD